MLGNQCDIDDDDDEDEDDGDKCKSHRILYDLYNERFVFVARQNCIHRFGKNKYGAVYQDWTIDRHLKQHRQVNRWAW